MSTSLYSNMGKTARQMIRRFGKGMVYRTKGDTQTYNPATMQYETQDEDVPFKGVCTSAKLEKNPELPVQLGDRIVLVCASDIPSPAVTAKIVMGQNVWSVVDAVTVGPGDVDLVHKILIRRG